MLDAHPEPELEIDIDIATCTSLPVLISGAPDETMRVAMTIASNDENEWRRRLLIVGAARSRIGASTLDAEGAGRVVLLRDVDTLDHDQQAWLIETILTRCRTAGTPDWRLITTTSVPLTDQVAAGAFAARLFYLLNAIHIVV
jgi:sigma-54-interacting transcriptional regulator